MTEQQLSLPLPEFKGSTYVESRDGHRLTCKLNRVREAMKGGEWWTLAMLSAATGAPEASASARIRDLRREGYVIERRYIDRGLFEYALKPPASPSHPAGSQ